MNNTKSKKINNEKKEFFSLLLRFITKESLKNIKTMKIYTFLISSPCELREYP
jgi:hypothetical protein